MTGEFPTQRTSNAENVSISENTPISAATMGGIPLGTAHDDFMTHQVRTLNWLSSVKSGITTRFTASIHYSYQPIIFHLGLKIYIWTVWYKSDFVDLLLGSSVTRKFTVKPYIELHVILYNWPTLHENSRWSRLWQERYIIIDPNTRTLWWMRYHRIFLSHTHTHVYIYIYIEREREREINYCIWLNWRKIVCCSVAPKMLTLVSIPMLMA